MLGFNNGGDVRTLPAGEDCLKFRYECCIDSVGGTVVAIRANQRCTGDEKHQHGGRGEKHVQRRAIGCEAIRSRQRIAAKLDDGTARAGENVSRATRGGVVHINDAGVWFDY
jgi:hypothetical protein